MKNITDRETYEAFTYVQSSHRADHVVLANNPEQDERTGRYYTEKEYGSDLIPAAHCPELKIYRFWKTHPEACYRESVMALVIEEGTSDILEASFALTEYKGSIKHSIGVEVHDTDRSVLGEIENAVMSWHSCGELKLNNQRLATIRDDGWVHNPYCQ